MDSVQVSINCLVYNHGKYLRRCLDGFLMQQTNFKFEVLIHDDASTDDSADIIREYEAAHPDIIKPIYQTENQYSKGVAITFTYQYPRAQGKYIAFCEGDDYWIDPLKLQKQVDYMEAHPDCTFCFTNGYIEDQQNNQKRRDFIPYNTRDAAFYTDENREFNLDNSHEMTFVPTASFLLRTDALMEAIKHYGGSCPTADLRLRLYVTAFGYAYYIKDKTCVYRQNVSGSAMSQWKRYDRKKRFEHNRKVLDMIDRLDAFTEGRHSDGLYKVAQSFVADLIANAPSLAVLKDPRNKKVFQFLSPSKKCVVLAKILIPESWIHFARRIRRRRGASQIGQ